MVSNECSSGWGAIPVSSLVIARSSQRTKAGKEWRTGYTMKSMTAHLRKHLQHGLRIYALVGLQLRLENRVQNVQMYWICTYSNWRMSQVIRSSVLIFHDPWTHNKHSRQKLCNPVNHNKVIFNLPWRNRKHVQPLPTEFFKPRITKLVSSRCSKWSVLPEQVQGVCRFSRFLSRLSLTWPTPRHSYSGLLPSPGS